MSLKNAFHFTRRVVFADCDMAGCVHFSRIFEILEEAEQTLYREAQVPWITPRRAWPRVRVECDYRSPAYLDEILTISLSIAKAGTSHLEWDFQITIRSDHTKNRLIAEGRLVTCFVQRDADAIHSTPIQATDLEKLKQATDGEDLCNAAIREVNEKQPFS